jgi:sulfoxide reductase heme-binding subunit YedZ
MRIKAIAAALPAVLICLLCAFLLHAEISTQTLDPTPIFWYLSRTSALLAYILLFINITLGIGLKTRYFDRIAAPWQKLDLHHFTAFLALSFILLHIFSLLGDQYLNFDLTQLLVPMASPFRPVWTALGVLAFYILIIVMLSSIVSKLIGRKAWRVLHYLSYAAFFAILFHGIRSGTETQFLWAQELYVATGAIAVFMFLWRFLVGGKRVPVVKQTNPA